MIEKLRQDKSHMIILKMFKALLISQWHSLSDAALEESFKSWIGQTYLNPFES